MVTSTTWVFASFIIYLLIMVAIGYFYMKDTENSSDYFLGGRGLSGMVAAFSAQASDMSSWLLMGLPGAIYALGTGQIWIAVGLMLGTIANWLFISGRLRAYTIKVDAITLPEYYEKRFEDKKRILLVISSIVIAIFFLVYTASALTAGGMLFNSVFGLDYHLALGIGALVILVYTFMGGFKAVCVTDLLQGMLMLICLLIVPLAAWFALGSAGGFGDLIAASDFPGGVNSFLDPLLNGGEPIPFIEILSQLAWGLGYCGMPHILVRFMAISSKKELKKSKQIAIGWIVLSLALAVLVGIVGRAYLMPMILGVNTDLSSENVFIQMIIKFFVEDHPLAFIGGFFLCGILAAIMSTADSQLLVTASAISSDLYKGVMKRDATEEAVLRLSRITVIVVAILAFIIAWDPNNSIMGLVSNAWAGLGAAFGPLTLFSLFWKRTNLPGAIAGMVSGGLTVIIWDYVPLIDGATLSFVTGIYSLLIGFFISCIFIVVVSLVTKAPSKQMEETFDSVKDVVD